MNLETVLSPAEFAALSAADLRETACVVLDILRATSTFVTALHHGAKEIIAVREIAEAVAFKSSQGEILLAGERDGVKIGAAQAGGVSFDLGNSPREFTRDTIGGRTLVSTTTNGTRALRACAGAKLVLAGSFLNLTATSDYLARNHGGEVLLVCAGTGANTALEDVLAAGALAELLTERGLVQTPLADATEIARRTYRQAQAEFAAIFDSSENARRLLAKPALQADVAFCRQRDIFDVVAVMGMGGVIRKA